MADGFAPYRRIFAYLRGRNTSVLTYNVGTPLLSGNLSTAVHGFRIGPYTVSASCFHYSTRTMHYASVFCRATCLKWHFGTPR